MKYLLGELTSKHFTSKIYKVNLLVKSLAKFTSNRSGPVAVAAVSESTTQSILFSPLFFYFLK